MTASERDEYLARGRPVDFVREATRHGGRGVVADFGAVGQDWGFSLAGIGRPVTVWHGDRDPLVPADHARRLAADLGASLEICAGAGHFLPMTHAERILTSLLP